MLALLFEARNGAGLPRVPRVGVGELGLIDAGEVIGCKGVRNQETEGSLHDKDLRVGAEQDVYIGAVCLERTF